MGEVYRAHDTRLDRSVAVKVLPAHLAADARLRERFDREARAVAALSHPHICAIYDFGDAPNPESQIPNPDTVSYLVMELLEGDTLDRRIHGQPMPPADVVDLGLQIAAGLEAAHAKGIVHRETSS
jgi:serine/threonine protein kinase